MANALPTPPRVPRVPRAIGLYLAAVQFFLAISWVVYVAYLPQLAKAAGLAPSWIPWVLMADQLVFLATDLAVGMASDRAARVLGRIGLAVVAATVLSSLAFLTLPHVALQGSPAGLLAVTLLWTVTSSALRAPPLTLLGRYVAKPDQPAMVALMGFGLGLASAAAPFLGLKLSAMSPVLPFALSAASLLAVTLGMVAAERSLARHGPAAPASVQAGAPQAGQGLAHVVGFLLACALGALAFQWHGFIASVPLALRHAPAADLPWVLPVFWVGFNLALVPAGLLAKRVGPLHTLALGAAVAATGNVLASGAPGLTALLASQAVAGAGWALVLCSAFAAALQIGQGGREGLLSGALSSTLAGAALLRIGFVALNAPKPAAVVEVAWLAALGFGLCAWLAWRRRA